MSATVLPQHPGFDRISPIKDSISKGISSLSRNVPSRPKKDEPSITIEPVSSPMSEKNVESFGVSELEGTPKIVDKYPTEVKAAPKKHAVARKAVASPRKAAVAAPEATKTKSTGRRRPALAKTKHRKDKKDKKDKKDDDEQDDTQDTSQDDDQADTNSLQNSLNSTAQDAGPDTANSVSPADIDGPQTSDSNDQQVYDVADQQNDVIIDEPVRADSGSIQGDGTFVDDLGLGDALDEVPVDDLKLSPEQTAKIMAQVQKYINGRKEAREKVVASYKAYADAWLVESEYGYRGQDGKLVTGHMQTYLNDELPEMLRMHSGRVGRNWRLNVWALAAGSAGLLPYGKPVLGAVARLRTKQIISEQFAIHKIQTDKARKKQQKKAAKAKVNKKAHKKAETKKQKAAQIAKWAAEQGAAALVDEAVGVPKEAVSGAFQEAASGVISSSVGESVSDFFSDLSSEVFFGSVGELIHFAPMVGQAYSAYKGFSNTRSRCKQDIKDALKTAMLEHGKTIIPETMTQ